MSVSLSVMPLLRSIRSDTALACLFTLAGCLLLILLCADVPHYLSPATAASTITTTSTISGIRSQSATPTRSSYVKVAIYSPKTPSLETRSLARLLRFNAPNTAGAVTVKYRWRERDFSVFQRDLASFPSSSLHSFVLVCEIWCDVEWEQFVVNNSSFSRAHIGLILLSDESRMNDYAANGMYNHFAFVFRNYLRPDIRQHVYYTLRSMPPHQRKLQWNRLAHVNHAYMVDTAAGVVTDCDSVVSNTSAVDWSSGFPSEDGDTVQRLYQHIRSLPPHALHHMHELVEQCWRRVEQLASSYHAFSTSEPWHHPQSFIVDSLSTVQRQYTTSNVYWFPLGCGNDVVDESIEQNWLPTSERPLLFGWIGHVSRQLKPERTVFIDSITHSISMARDSNHSAVVRLFTDEVVIKQAQGFNQPLVQLLHYTQLMLDSRYMPIPAGISPEQFRIWEAMQHYTHPIVLSRDVVDVNGAVLQYLARLALDPITVQSWSDLPAVLLQLELLPPSIVDEWQQYRRARLQSVMSEMSRQLHELVVATTVKR